MKSIDCVSFNEVSELTELNSSELEIVSGGGEGKGFFRELREVFSKGEYAMITGIGWVWRPANRETHFWEKK